MRNTVSIVFLIILVIATPVMLVVTSIKYNVVTPRFLKRELASHQAYAIATGQIDHYINNIKIDPHYPITNEEIITLTHQVVSDAWLRQNVESILDRFFAWLNAPAGATLTLPLDVRTVNMQLFSSIDALLAAKLPQLQPCQKRGQTEGLCTFAGMTVPQAKEELKHAGLDLTTIQTLLPDTIDVVNPDLSALLGPQDTTAPNSLYQKNQEIIAKLNRIKTVYHQALRYFLFAWIGYGLLIAGYVVLNATKGWRRLVRWVGILCLAIGVLPVALYFAAKQLVAQKLIPSIHFDAAVAANVQTIVPAVIHDVQQAMLLSVLITGAALMVIGLAAIIGAHFIPRPVVEKK